MQQRMREKERGKIERERELVSRVSCEHMFSLNCMAKDCNVRILPAKGAREK